MDIKIKNVAPETVAQLDALVARLGYSDRSALVRDILQRYVVMQEQFIVDLLPDMTKAILDDALKEYPERLHNLLEYVLKSQEKTDRVLSQIVAALDDK